MRALMVLALILALFLIGACTTAYQDTSPQLQPTKPLKVWPWNKRWLV